MENMKEVKKFAVNIRKETIKCIGNLGVGHIGGSLSIADVLAVLYGNTAFDAAAERVKNAVRIGGKDEVPVKESIEVFIGEKWEILKSE